MALTLITVLADDAGETQVDGPEREAQLFGGFAAGAGVRGFAGIHVQLAAARAPEAEVRLLRAFEQQDFVALVETVEQRSDFIRQRHGRLLSDAMKEHAAVCGKRICD